jgi:CRP-like cAMP-binding protein
MVRDGLFFVKEGALRLYVFNPEGKQFTVGIPQPVLVSCLFVWPNREFGELFGLSARMIQGWEMDQNTGKVARALPTVEGPFT